MTKRLLLIIISINFCFLAAKAINIPQDIQTIMHEDFPKGIFRVDGVFQNGQDLWLPVIPRDPVSLVDDEQSKQIELMLVNDDRDFMFSNGWIYTPIKDNTIKSLEIFEKPIQEQILKNKISPEFIVPKDFLLPRDLAIITGHLPIKYRDVELATEREERYLDILKQEIKDATLELFSYDFNSGDFKLSIFSMKDQRLKSLGKKSPTEDSKLTMYEVADLKKEISLLSQLKKINDQMYIVDYNKSKVFQLRSIDGGFDLVEVYSVGAGLGLQDYATSVDGQVSYLLTNKKPQLIIYDNQINKQIKVLDLPPNPDSLLSFSKDATQTDFIVVNCKGANKVIFISSFDHRIVKELEVGKMPIDMAYNSENLFVANKADKSVSVVDWVSRTISQTIDLEYIPSKLLVSPDQNFLYVLSGLDAKISVYETSTFKLVKHIDLGSDLIEPKDMALSPSGFFIIVGSSSSDLIGIVDLGTMELVKKIDIKNHSNKLITGKFSK